MAGYMIVCSGSGVDIEFESTLSKAKNLKKRLEKHHEKADVTFKILPHSPKLLRHYMVEDGYDIAETAINIKGALI